MNIHYTYWNNKGRYQNAADRLERLIPASGAVDLPKSANKALEKFRVAANCYYDLYNNGLINRATEFRRVFGFSPAKKYGHTYKFGFSSQAGVDAVEAVMDKLILLACVEQNIHVNN